MFFFPNSMLFHDFKLIGYLRVSAEFACMVPTSIASPLARPNKNSVTTTPDIALIKRLAIVLEHI